MKAAPKICLMGASLGTGNRGVSALAASLVKLALRSHPGAVVRLLIGQRTRQDFTVNIDGAPYRVGVANFRRSLKARPGQQVIWWAFLAALYRLVPSRPWRRLLARHPLIGETAEADFVGDIRGGDSFSDIYGLGTFLWGSLPVVAVLLVRRRIVLLPQTCGPFKSALARFVAAFILKRASAIFCRDRESLGAVSELTSGRCRACFCPDVAFCLDATLPEKPLIEPPLQPGKAGCLVGLNVNGLVFNGGHTRDNMFGLKLDYRRYAIDLASALLADPATRLLLVPHTFAPDDSVESDPAACRQVRQQLPLELRARAHLVTGEYNQSEIKGIIGLCDFFVGSRMHACIAALSQGIPTVGVAYSKKFKGVFDTVGMAGAVVDGRDCGVQEALQKTMEIFGRREQLRDPLKTAVHEAQDALYRTFQDILAGGEPEDERRPFSCSAEDKPLASGAGITTGGKTF
jgi:polysaccharide pyruvyl transferase WcaK-like protein